MARLDLLKRHMPEHPWPSVDPAEILEQMCQGKRSVEELNRVSAAPFIMAQLHYPLDRLLEEHAPQTIEVPTGNRIRVDYAIGQPPVLAVRLQEMFGLLDTPRVAAGRVPVTLHLLGPNFRPVQISNDLRSFWTTTYFQVRKDLRVRYPKHSWPEDPLTATPQAKGSRRH
jgi:ATP-dependent helicase HrpB